MKKTKKKRKFLASILLFWSLFFSPIKQSSAQSKNSRSDQPPVHTKCNTKNKEVLNMVEVSDSESIASEEEIQALGLDNTEVRLVLGGSNPRLRYLDLMETIRADREETLAKQSQLPVNIEGKDKVILIETKSDLRSRQWINDFLSSVNRGGQQDELLVRSILSKLANSDVFDIPSVNKILYQIAEASLSVLSNQKLTRILAQFEVLFDHVQLPAADAAFNLPRLPIRRPRDDRDNVEFKREPQSSRPSINSVLDTTKCYGHREGYDMPRGVSDVFGSKALALSTMQTLIEFLNIMLFHLEYHFIEKE